MGMLFHHQKFLGSGLGHQGLLPDALRIFGVVPARERFLDAAIGHRIAGALQSPRVASDGPSSLSLRLKLYRTRVPLTAPPRSREAKRGAGGGTRTRTTLPSRDFKSLASTSSATSALLNFHSFLLSSPQYVSKFSLDVSKITGNPFTLRPS